MKGKEQKAGGEGAWGGVEAGRGPRMLREGHRACSLSQELKHEAFRVVPQGVPETLRGSWKAARESRYLGAP